VSHPTPQTLRNLRDRAEACERLAETAIGPETREIMGPRGGGLWPMKRRPNCTHLSERDRATPPDGGV